MKAISVEELSKTFSGGTVAVDEIVLTALQLYMKERREIIISFPRSGAGL